MLSQVVFQVLKEQIRLSINNYSITLDVSIDLVRFKPLSHCVLWKVAFFKNIFYDWIVIGIHVQEHIADHSDSLYKE